MSYVFCNQCGHRNPPVSAFCSACGTVLDLVSDHTITLAKTDALQDAPGPQDDIHVSLSQISQIVEGNDAKILSAYVANVPNSTKVEVTLKTNKEDLTRILQTFIRYNYIVKATFHQSSFEEDMRSRYDEFINYINM